MQTCKFTLTLNPASSIHLRGVTPAELVCLHALHFKESAGSPIGADLQLEPGEALTVDVPGKAGEGEYFHTGTGKQVLAKEPIPAITHARTDKEEIERLKRKYNSKPPHIKNAPVVFEHAFGAGSMVRIPHTFDEVLERLGIGSILPEDHEFVDTASVAGLLKLSRFELANEALTLKLKVKPSDSKEQIVANILDARAKLEAASNPKSKEDFLKHFAEAGVPELKKLQTDLTADDQSRPAVVNALAAVNELLSK
jgi:hypothetical protein